MSAWIRAGVVLALVVTVACSGKQDGRTPTFPVRGSVLHDGRPAAGAVVILHPLTAQPAGTPLPRAKVNPDGSFVLTTYVTNDGAPAGDFAVAVTWRQPTEYAEQEGPSLLPDRYGDPKRSNLKVTIQPQPNELAAFRLGRTP